MGVDDLLVQEIAGQPERLGRELGRPPGALGEAVLGSGGLQIAPAERALAPRAAQDGPLDHRELLLRDDRDVHELAQEGTLAVDDPAVLDLAQIGHRAERTHKKGRIHFNTPDGATLRLRLRWRQ